MLGKPKPNQTVTLRHCLITGMWMECQRGHIHIDVMESGNIKPVTVINEPIGIKAMGRESVDLIFEAERLKFSADEIAELQRLYVLAAPAAPVKTPQS